MTIDLMKARKRFAAFLASYGDSEEPGFRLKVVHTYHVTENAGILAENVFDSNEDRELAELIGLLHDIGRFEELRVTHELNNLKFDHAAYGVKMLFEDGMIRDFIDDSQYDEIIRKAILYHSLKTLPEGMTERERMHAMLIRDADKLDNFRVKIEEPVENLFPGRVTSAEALEESEISEKILEPLLAMQCADIRDRATPLDYYACIIGFAYDLNFPCSKETVLQERYIERMTDRFQYRRAAEDMNRIRETALRFLKESTD